MGTEVAGLCLKHNVSLLSHLGEEVSLYDCIHVHLPWHVALKLKIVADPYKFVLLSFQYIFNDVKKWLLSEVHKAIEHFQCVLVRNDIWKEAEEWVRE